MRHRLELAEQICSARVKSVIEAYKESEFYKVRVLSTCPTIQLFEKKINELKWNARELYGVRLHDIWLLSKELGIKCFCPIPTAIMDVLWLESGMISESLALKTKTNFSVVKNKYKKFKLSPTLCGYDTFIRINSNSQGLEVKIITPCPQINQSLSKDVENINSLDDCEKLYKNPKITPTCWVPVAVSIAVAIELGVIKINENDPIFEIEYKK
jgi:hypothetical protein